MSNKQTEVVEQIVPRGMDNPKAAEILNGPHMTIRFPLDVVQTDSNAIAVPCRLAESEMFDEHFENRVREIMGLHPGNVFLEEMRSLVVRKMFIAQIR